MTNTNSKSQISFWPFMVISIAWYGYAYFLSQSLVKQPFGMMLINVLIFAIPIALSGTYSIAVNQARTVSFYRQGGWTYWFFSRRFIKAILWIVWALISSFIMLVLFVSYSTIDWISLATLIPIYWIIQTKSRRFLASELKKGYVLTNYSITWARWICLVIMLIFYAVLIKLFDEPSSYMPLFNTVTEQQKVIVEGAGSGTVRLALEISTFKDGVQLWMIQHLGQFGKIYPQLLGILGRGIIFFNATATLSSFVIHKHEYRRIFGPITDDELPAPLLRKTIALSSAVITFLLLFICLPLTADIEESIHAHPDWLHSIQATETQLYAYAEQIDNKFYKPDTIKKIQDNNAEALRKMNDPNLRAVLEGSIDKAFDHMEANVDGYLDWYYSLGAEYMRLAKLMTGAIESDMQVQLVKRLTQGDVTQTLFDGLNEIVDGNKIIEAARQSVEQKILEDNRLPNDCAKVNILKSMSLNDMFSMPDYILGATHFNNRLATGGLVATGISAAVITKVISKGTFKIAAKAVSKVALKKAAAAGTGSTIGAVFGSIIPGAGTVAGGVAGAIIAGVLLDKGILMLEELTDRKEFKEKIIAGIRESKAEFKDKIFKNQPLSSPEDSQLMANAEQGNADAQVKLGLKYQNGDGVEKNDTVAVEWYRKAADQGNLDAQVNLGNMYRNGTGLEKSDTEAISWFRKSANQGNAIGQNLLGVMYVNGSGVEKSNTEAVSWFRKAADQGQSDAQLNLGVMYQKGNGGTEKNDLEAVTWYRKSAEQGNSDAQLNLGVMYQNGFGIEKNDVEAVSWYRKSADQGNTEAQISLGVMYQNGDGVAQSDEDAVFWYKKASIVNGKSNVRLFDTGAYKANFNQFVSLKGTDEYVITELKKPEFFDYHKENVKWIFDRSIEIGGVDADITLDANYKYFVKLSELQYVIQNDTLVFTVPNLSLSIPVAYDSSTLKRKCVPHGIATCANTLHEMTKTLTPNLEERGQSQKAYVYEKAAEALAENFDKFAKNNDKGVFYKKIAVVFENEPGKKHREFNFNKSYCGNEPCSVEIPFGNGRFLTIQ